MRFDWLWDVYVVYGVGRELTVGLTLAVLALGVSFGLSLHILTRRRQGATVAWLALIWMSPLIGWVAYVLLGVNRVQRTAARLQDRVPDGLGPAFPSDDKVPPAYRHFARLALANRQITGRPLIGGNRFTPLRNGDEAYPAMLDAIAAATQSVTLLTYILDDDPVGSRFVDALIATHQRGVEVRVLIDGIGARRAGKGVKRLRSAGVPTHTFLWSWVPWKMALVNLRNHRKLVVADGALGFTGGINIREAYLHEGNAGSVACDLHFRVEGPVVRELQRQFALDWAFEAGETLEGPVWFPDLELVGTSLARVLPHGPDEDLRKIASVLFQAVTLAEREVTIVTPYFLPDEPLTAALEAAAQRGVHVTVILPESNEPGFMNALTTEDVAGSLEQGVRLGFKPGPFEHTKLTVVDRTWTLLGSSNWDPRSLRLNFELNVEVYDPVVAEASLAAVEEVFRDVRWVVPSDLASRSTLQLVKTRTLRLFKPYL